MPRKSSKPAQYTIGIDIGYGATKAIIADAAPLVFPSVWGHARPILEFSAAKIAKDYPGDQITDPDGTQWFVGNLANSRLSAGEILRLRGRTANEESDNEKRVRLAKVAIGKLIQANPDEVVHLRVATGLPVDHMAGATQLKAALIGEHRIQTDAVDYVANVYDVIVMPQPFGTIYANMLTPAGDLNPCHTATRTGVVDVGTYTVDIALDDQGEYIDAESGSVESGIYLAQQQIAQLISNQHHQIPKAATVEEVLRTGCLRAKGKLIDYSAEVEAALEPIRSATISKMGELWQAGLNVHTIYLSGGGAALVEKAIKAAGFNQAVLVENAQLANATGYLNYAAYKSAQG